MKNFISNTVGKLMKNNFIKNRFSKFRKTKNKDKYNKRSKKLVVISTGGTGGHYFPAKALSDSFLKSNYNVVVFLDKRAYKYKKIWDRNISVHKIYSMGYNNVSILQKLKAIFLIKIGTLQSLYYLIKNRPSVLISFGSYSSVPLVLTAIILRIPIVMHEQNSFLGKSHSVFVKYAKKLIITFNNTRNIPHKVEPEVLGLPVRKEFLFYRNKYKEESNKITFLIIGGSLGAQVFSDVIPKTFSKLPENIQDNIIVYHQCREEIIKNVEKQWKSTSVDYKVKSFFTNTPELLWSSDIVISRSGASTITEINAIGRYALYIPYAVAANDHQKYNAINAKKYSGADYLEEKDFNANTLRNFLEKVINDRDIIKSRGLIAKQSFDPSSMDKIISSIENVI